MSGALEKDDLIMDIGHLILSDPDYGSGDWDAISLVFDVRNGRNGFHGYVYAGEDWTARHPRENAFDLMDRAKDLQDAMAAETGDRWKQALIHITRPGPEINVQFEYDDPTRWSLKKVSLDLSDYAESLRPPRR